jgi:hypothetical protein
MSQATSQQQEAPAGAQAFKFPDEITSETVQPGEGDDIEVEIVDDTPPEERRAPLAEKVEDPTDDELDGYSEKVRSRIDKLTHARRDEERRASAAERRAQEAETLAQRLLEQNKALTKNHNSTQEVLVTNAREKAEAELVAARAALKQAHDNFDTDKIVEAQERLAQATLQAAAVKNYRPTPLQEDDGALQTRQPQQQAVVEPDEKSLRWQQANQWFGADEEATSFALGVHQKLLRSGVDPRSDDYYAQINARMKQKFPELFSREQERPQSGEQAPRRQPATVVAPAARSSGPRKIVLTKTQQQLAARLGLTNQQYAAALAKQENQ